MNIIQPQLGILSGPYSLHGFPLLASLEPFRNWILLISVHSAKKIYLVLQLRGFILILSHLNSTQREMTPEQQQQTGRDQRPKEHCRIHPVASQFHVILGGNASTGAHTSDFPVFLWIALPCPWHQAWRSPPWWNLPTGWAVKSTLQLGCPSTAAKNNRDNRWRESWDVEPNVPQASFVFSVRGNFSMQLQPWSTRGAGKDLSSPSHPESFPGCANSDSLWGCWSSPLRAEGGEQLKLRFLKSLRNPFSPSINAEICHCLAGESLVIHNSLHPLIINNYTKNFQFCLKFVVNSVFFCCFMHFCCWYQYPSGSILGMDWQKHLLHVLISSLCLSLVG